MLPLLRSTRCSTRVGARLLPGRSLSTSSPREALNIYVRWDDPSDRSKFNEAKVRGFFSYKGFETREIVPLPNIDRTTKGVNSALVEVRDADVQRCLEVDYGSYVSVKPYTPAPPTPPPGPLAKKTLAIRGVPLGSDQAGYKDPHHTQRQLARRLLEETGVLIGNAKTLREAAKDGRTTVHVFVPGGNEDVRKLLKWEVPEGMLVEQLPKKYELVQAFDKTKLFKELSTPLLPLPPSKTIEWQPATRPVSTPPPTRSNPSSTSKPNPSSLSSEERSRLRTTGPRRQVGFGKKLKQDFGLLSSSSSSTSDPSTSSASTSPSSSTPTPIDFSAFESNPEPEDQITLEELERSLMQHEASDANYSFSSSDSLFPAPNPAHTPDLDSNLITSSPPHSSNHLTNPAAVNPFDETDLEPDIPFQRARLASDDTWRQSQEGGMLMDPDGGETTGTSSDVEEGGGGERGGRVDG